MAGIFSNQLGLQIIHHHVVIKGRLNNIHQFLPIKEGPHGFPLFFSFRFPPEIHNHNPHRLHELLWWLG